MPQRLPNFFIVGAPKAATTALYACLGQHPLVYMSPLKEPNYFATELRLPNFLEADRPRIAREMRALQQYLRGDLLEKRFGGLVENWEDYLMLFRNVANETAVGEASACYLWSRSAPRNIAARIPRAKIIISLRNPVDRAFSQYLQMMTLGAIHRSFRDQVEANLSCTERKFGPQWPLLEFGFYHEQVSRYLQEFPRSQIQISLYEDLQRDPRLLVSQLFAFLGVDPAFDVDVTRRHHQPSVPKLSGAAYLLKKWGLWPYLRNLAPRPLGPRLRSLFVHSRASLTMDRTDRRFLVDYYRDDIEKLAVLLDRDLTGWLECSAEGSRSSAAAP